MRLAPSHRTLAVTLGLLLLSVAVPAQEDPFNAAEVGTWDLGSPYADVWGDGDFAYVARFGQNRIDIVDISNPAAPFRVAEYNTNISGSAQDVKVHDGLMFVGIESASPGAQIVDVRNPTNPVQLTNLTVRAAVHNLFYDDGWLYLVDSQQNQIDIVDLRDYDPDNPPGTITDETYRLNNVGNVFVHDITVADGRLYAAAWGSLEIFDVSNLDAGPPVNIGSTPGNSVHAVWPTADGAYLVVTEERSGGGALLYEVEDNGGSLDLTLRDTLFLSGSRTTSAHNPVIDGDRVYMSFYQAGVQVMEIDRQTSTWDLVASFDTTVFDGGDGFFDGCWGVYPLLGADTVLASDMQTGLWILDVDPNILRFDYPIGIPTTVRPGVQTPLQVNITSIGAAVNSGTAEFVPSIDGAPQGAVTLTDLGGGLFEGDLPAAACGSVIEFFTRADNLLGDSFTDPKGAPGELYAIDVTEETILTFEDTFNADLGWTVSNSDLDTGAWERGNPRGTSAQPEDDFDGDGGNSCFFTDQGPINGGDGDADVDGGPTRLTSPSMDFSLGDGVIRYAYWMSNDDGDDSMIVEVRSNNGPWVEATRYTGGSGGWFEDVVRVGELVTPTSNVQIRFSISDNPNDSVTEGAIDYVRAEVFSCDPGGGGDITLSVSDMVRGQPVTFTVTGAESGELVRFAGNTGGLGAGPCPPFLGGLCFDIVAPVLDLGSATADGSGTAVFESTVPSAAPFDTAFLQAVVGRGPGGADSVKSNVEVKPVTD